MEQQPNPNPTAPETPIGSPPTEFSLENRPTPAESAVQPDEASPVPFEQTAFSTNPAASPVAESGYPADSAALPTESAVLTAEQAVEPFAIEHASPPAAGSGLTFESVSVPQENFGAPLPVGNGESAPPPPPFDFSASPTARPPYDFSAPPAAPPPTSSAPVDAEIVPPAPRKEKSNLFLRVITALIGIPIVMWLVWHAWGSVFTGVVALLALLSLRELGGAMRKAGFTLMRGLAYPALIVLLFSQRIGTSESRAGALLLWTLPFVLLIGLLIESVLRYGQSRRLSLQSVALSLLATFYVGLFSFVILLRTLKWPAPPVDSGFNIFPPEDILPRLAQTHGPQLGPSLLWLTLLAVWTGDTVAYFVGRWMGKEKLTPLSPGKTWEGAVAGLTATIAVCIPLSVLLGLEIQHGVALGILIALTAPLGDLAESFWKRELNVKDIGGCLPGHGGILDRCDSLLFAVFAVYVYAQLALVR